MQKVIMIPEERYDKMMKSYDEAMAELVKLRGLFSELNAKTEDHYTGRTRGSKVPVS